MRRTPIVDADERRASLLLAHGAAAIVEAPAGYGKSRLLELVARQIESSELVVSADRLRALVDETPPATVLIDIDQPDPAVVAHLAAHDRVESMVVAGRVVGTVGGRRRSGVVHGVFSDRFCGVQVQYFSSSGICSPSVFPWRMTRHARPPTAANVRT